MSNLFSNPPTNSYRRLPDTDEIILVVGAPYMSTEFSHNISETARIEVPVGEYRLRPVAVGGAPSTFSDAAHFIGSGQGVLIRGGRPDETIGETIRTFRFKHSGRVTRNTIRATSAP